MGRASYTYAAGAVRAMQYLGMDPGDVNGLDYIAPLTNTTKLDTPHTFNFTSYLYDIASINPEVWRSRGVDGDALAERFIDRVLADQTSDGGFDDYYGFSVATAKEGETVLEQSSVPETISALSALAPYRDKENVAAAIEAGLTYLSSVQLSDGSFAYTNRAWRDAPNGAVTLSMLSLMDKLDISIDDERFVKNGNTVADAMRTFYVDGVGFISDFEVDAPLDGLDTLGYCRVSSSSEDQLNSFAAQNIHYTQYITEHEDWRLVDIYADEGISGTSVEKRDDFKRMLADSGRGLIDRVLVKSISRFARNTAECLEAIRQFRANGTTIFFEKENIDTVRMSSELMAALHAAFSQSESESISGNMRWSYQKRMERGEYNPQSAGFGYCLKEGKLAIVPAEAKIVRFVFESYLSGASRRAIVKQLNATMGGKLWYESAISYILTNECYMGDTMLQKTYSTGPLPVKRHRNKGQRTQYYMAGTHPAIISKHDFEKVQTLLETKKAQYTKAQQKSRFPFAKKLCCRECGSTLRRKEQKGYTYWCCMTHDVDKRACALPPIPEVQIQQAFLRLYYNLKHQGNHILPDLIANLQSIRERKFLWSVDVIELNKQIAELTSQNQLLATLRESGCVDPDIFISKSNALTEQLRAAKQAKSRILNQDGDDTIPCTQELIIILKRGPETPRDFDGELFGQLIDKVIIESNTSLRFRLKNGLELRESIERTVR